MPETPWIVVSQAKEDMERYSGELVMVAKCTRCESELPLYAGPVDLVCDIIKAFTKQHKRCKERKAK